MHHRPIQRSKTLWLGIITLTFLAWAWHYSLHWWSTASYRNYTIAHAGSGIFISRSTTGKMDPLFYEHGAIWRTHGTWAHPRLEAPNLFRCTDIPAGSLEPFHVDYLGSDPWDDQGIPRTSAAHHFDSYISTTHPGSWSIYLPHWLIIILFLIPWTSLLISRHRRHAKHHPH